MKKYSQFIFVLMLSTSFATMARADDDGTSLDNCARVAGDGNCEQIGNSGTYYALSGDEGNQTMTIYGTSGSTAATVPEFAFFDYEYWKSTFPGGVTSLKTSGNVDIGDFAFNGATGLTSVDLTGVQRIGYEAFWGATGLTGHLDLTGVQSIGGEAFAGATGLTSVDLTGVQTIEDFAFAYATGLTNANLTGVQTIGVYAFSDATGLTSVDLTDVQSIGHGAFSGATGLTSVDLTGVQSIGGEAFRGATGLTSIDLTGVQSIGGEAFADAWRLKSIVISDSLLDSNGNITGIDPYAFVSSGLNTIYCPKDNDCDNSFEGVGDLKIIPYSIDKNGQIKAGGKTYASLDDLASGNHIVKRIYTIDEANAVAGKTNSFKIRYR